jgi:4-hydroxybenzoate polyprenyltransferase
MYLITDLVDVAADRLHPSKRNRPLASGKLSKPIVIVAAIVLGGCGLGIGWGINWSFLVVLGCYIIAALVYTWFLKRQVLLDVFCLAGLYTIRLFGGQEATGIRCSEWLLAFSLFLFLSLAVLKRFHEAFALRAGKTSALPGRGYSSSDVEFLSIFGFLCGALAVLVMALYANSEQVRLLYERPAVLLTICPLLLYWISRFWLLAHRGEMHHDPVAFALRDPASYAVGIAVLGVAWLARPVI